MLVSNEPPLDAVLTTRHLASFFVLNIVVVYVRLEFASPRAERGEGALGALVLVSTVFPLSDALAHFVVRAGPLHERSIHAVAAQRKAFEI